MPNNTETPLSFSDDHIAARWVTDAVKYPIDTKTIVVNTSTHPIRYEGGVVGILAVEIDHLGAHETLRGRLARVAPRDADDEHRRGRPR